MDHTLPDQPAMTPPQYQSDGNTSQAHDALQRLAALERNFQDLQQGQAVTYQAIQALTAAIDRMSTAETARTFEGRGPGPRVKEPRQYDGSTKDGALDDHIRDITTYIDYYDRRGFWQSEDEKIQVCSTYLIGRIHKLWLVQDRLGRENPENRLISFTAYCQWIRNLCVNPDERNRLNMEWHALVQGSKLVADYAADILHLGHRITPQKSDNEVREHFRMGLDLEIELELSKDLANDDLPLMQLINKANRIETALRRRDYLRRNTGRRDRSHEPAVNALVAAPRRGAQFLSSSKVPRKGTQEWQDHCRSRNACFNCGRTGHRSRECSEPSDRDRGRPSERRRSPSPWPRGRSESRDRSRSRSQSRASTRSPSRKAVSFAKEGKAFCLKGTEAPSRQDTTASNQPRAEEFEELSMQEYVASLNTQSGGGRMCLLEGSVNVRNQEHKIRILLDSGSDHQYIAKALVEELRIPTTEVKDGPTWVKVANGTFAQIPGKARIRLGIGQYRESLSARIVDLPDFDLILGYDWLRRNNPDIDWQTLSVSLTDKDGQFHTLAQGGVTPSLLVEPLACSVESVEPISRQAALKMLRRPDTCAHLLVIKANDAPTPDPKPERFGMIRRGFEKVRKLLKRFASCFKEELPDELPPTRNYEHRIDTGNADPININAYPLSPIHLQEQSRQIAKMLKQGLIQESSSPWGFPVLFVKKPGGKWRMCVDFRALNAVTRKNGYPLPRIQECLDLIGKAKFMSKLDLTQGYYQIRVAPEDREKTAFNTREGKFEYLAMPFGLSNAPATFQTLMNRILRKFIGKFVIVYLDDIVVFSNDLDEHVQHLELVLEVLRDNKLFAKPSKCSFAQSILEFCGHLVGEGKIRPQQSKIAIIRDWPQPKNVHEVRQFLGLASYYRRFIRGFAQIAVPLFELLKEADAETRKRKFRAVNWNLACEAAFRKLKEKLISEPVLRQPDTSREFMIETDASEWALGYALLQKDPENGRTHPVAFDGRKLTPAEVNYPVHEKELLAIKCALQAWRIYVDNGHQTTILTDHESLKYLATMRNPSKRLARWIDEFGEYDLNIQYRRGSQALVPDTLSRRPDFMGEGPRNQAARITLMKGVDEDEWAQHMTAFLRDNVEPPETIREDIFENQRAFTVDDEGQLLHQNDDRLSPYLPVTVRADFLEQMHKEYGHLGYPGLLGVVDGRGWWHSLERDIRSFAKECRECQCSQRSRPNQERELPRILSGKGMQLFDRWAIDLIGILPKTPAGNLWIFTGIEFLTGWPVAVALPDAKAETVARALHDAITTVYGPMRELLSDNGPNLIGKIMDAYLRLLKVKHRVTTPYHPRTNGKVENFNGLLGSVLTKLLVNKPTKLWDQYLPQALFATRIRIHSAHGKSPYYLLFGKHPRLFGDENPPRPMDVPVAEDLIERVRKMQHARVAANELLVEKAVKAQKIRNERVKDSSFHEGDWVLVRAESRNKFEARWFGPYKIDKVMLLGTYRLATPTGEIVKTLINGQRLIPAVVKDGQIEKFWNSSQIQGELRRQNMIVEKPSPEIEEILGKEAEETPTYDELAVIPAKEWKRLERSGDRSALVGEEMIETARKTLEKVIGGNQSELGQLNDETREESQFDDTPDWGDEAREEPQQGVSEGHTSEETRGEAERDDLLDTIVVNPNPPRLGIAPDTDMLQSDSDEDMEDEEFVPPGMGDSDEAAPGRELPQRTARGRVPARYRN